MRSSTGQKDNVVGQDEGSKSTKLVLIRHKGALHFFDPSTDSVSWRVSVQLDCRGSAPATTAIMLKRWGNESTEHEMRKEETEDRIVTKRVSVNALTLFRTSSPFHQAPHWLLIYIHVSTFWMLSSEISLRLQPCIITKDLPLIVPLKPCSVYYITSSGQCDASKWEKCSQKT